MLKKYKINVCGLFILMAIQVSALLLLNCLIGSLDIQQAFLKEIIIAAAIVISVAVDIVFFNTKIRNLKKLSKKLPERCKIEDIIFLTYKDEGRSRYSPYLLIRSLKGGKLYFTYDRYAMVGFHTGSSYSNNQLESCEIYRKDRSTVKIGDCVDMYLLKIIKIPVSINKAKNTVKLKNETMPFAHINQKVGIDEFNDVTFFKGAIDVDSTLK